MKFKNLIITLTTAVLLIFSTGCLITADEEDSNYFNAKISDKALMFLLQLMAGNSGQSSCSDSSEVMFQGTVLDSRSGNPLANVQVETEPASIVKVTNTSGEYVLDQDICDGSNYEIKFSKYGYFDDNITQKANASQIDVGENQIDRDTTKFNFVSVIVMDSGGNLLSNATIEFYADGATQEDVTGSGGTISLPIAKSQETQAFTVTYDGKAGSATFNQSTDACTVTETTLTSCTVEGGDVIKVKTLN